MPAAAAAWWAKLRELQGVWAIEATPIDISRSSPSDMAHALARARVAAVHALESTCRRSMSAQRRQMQRTVCMLEVRRLDSRVVRSPRCVLLGCGVGVPLPVALRAEFFQAAVSALLSEVAGGVKFEVATLQDISSLASELQSSKLVRVR